MIQSHRNFRGSWFFAFCLLLSISNVLRREENYHINWDSIEMKFIIPNPVQWLIRSDCHPVLSSNKPFESDRLESPERKFASHTKAHNEDELHEVYERVPHGIVSVCVPQRVSIASELKVVKIKVCHPANWKVSVHAFSSRSRRLGAKETQHRLLKICSVIRLATAFNSL